MLDTHEPRDEFIERLAGQIRLEVRRRHQSVQEPRWTRWLLQSPLKTAIAVAALVIVSMGIGGGVVAAAYQAQTNEQRNLLLASYAQRVALAQQRVAIAADQLRTAQQRVSVGIDPQEAALEAQFKVAEAERQLRVTELELAEVQAAGREPLNAVSSPLVSGRDFVSDRWKIEMSVPAAALEIEKSRLQGAERRFAAGVAGALDAQASRIRMVELEAAIEGFRTKIDIRQRFLKREIDAGLAELRVLESEAQQRGKTLAPRIELARNTVKDLTAKFDTGTAQRVDLMEAELRLRALELDSLKAAMDLAIIQRQIAQRRTGR